MKSRPTAGSTLAKCELAKSEAVWAMFANVGLKVCRQRVKPFTTAGKSKSGVVLYIRAEESAGETTVSRFFSRSANLLARELIIPPQSPSYTKSVRRIEVPDRATEGCWTRRGTPH